MLILLNNWIKSYGIPKALYFDKRKAYVDNQKNNQRIPKILLSDIIMNMKQHFSNHELIAVLSFVLWGLFPPYFKLLENVHPIEIILHRIIWSCVLMMIIVVCSKQFSGLLSILRQKTLLLKLLCSSLLISTNWLIFVHAVNTNRVLETSLGYYSSPLISIFLGTVFLKEKVGTIKKIAIVLAIIALTIKISKADNISYIMVLLALTFSCYGLIKKTITANSLLLFTVETLLLSIPATIGLLFMLVRHQSVITTPAMSPVLLLLLFGLGVLTSTPLLLFNRSVKHVDLNIIGFIQYITPSMTFLTAILWYKEAFDVNDFLVFSIIWTAIILVSIENYRNKKKTKI